MKKKIGDIGVVLAVAVLTAFAAGLVLEPETAGADDPVRVSNVVEGAEIEVVFDKAAYEPGEKPVLTLTAVNRGREVVTSRPTVRLTTSNVWRMSRAPVMPKGAWSKELTLTLKPGQRQTVVLEPEVAAEASTEFGVLVTAPAPAPDPQTEPVAEGE